MVLNLVDTSHSTHSSSSNSSPPVQARVVPESSHCCCCCCSTPRRRKPRRPDRLSSCHWAPPPPPPPPTTHQLVLYVDTQTLLSQTASLPNISKDIFFLLSPIIEVQFVSSPLCVSSDAFVGVQPRSSRRPEQGWTGPTSDLAFATARVES